MLRNGRLRLKPWKCKRHFKMEMRSVNDRIFFCAVYSEGLIGSGICCHFIKHQVIGFLKMQCFGGRKPIFLPLFAELVAVKFAIHR